MDEKGWGKRVKREKHKHTGRHQRVLAWGLRVCTGAIDVGAF